MPHVLCVVQVGDGEVQGEEHQGRGSGCCGGRREICSAGIIVNTKGSWGYNQGTPAVD